MLISLTATYDLLARHGVFAREACDRCGQVLGAVRWTRRGELGVWCSQACRGDIERPAIHRGGRPQKYRTPEESRAAKTSQQREYRNGSVWKKPVSSLLETKDLQAQKVPLSHTPSGAGKSRKWAASEIKAPDRPGLLIPRYPRGEYIRLWPQALCTYNGITKTPRTGCRTQTKAFDGWLDAQQAAVRLSWRSEGARESILIPESGRARGGPQDSSVQNWASSSPENWSSST